MKKERPIDRYINGIYTQRDKQSLKKSGILIMKKYSQKEVLRMIKERDFKRCIPKKCEWCGKETLIIHEHHFPLEKSLGGKETVKICPTCHYEYHLLNNGNYELAEGWCYNGGTPDVCKDNN